MESYIVRVYRRSRSDSGEVAGLVETVGSDEKESFQSFSGLIRAIRHAVDGGAGSSVYPDESIRYPDRVTDIKTRAG